MSRTRKIILAAVVLIALFMVASYFVLPPIFKSVLTKKLSESLHRDTSIESIEFNPFTISLKIKGFLMKDRNSAETFVSFRELFVDAGVLSIIKRAVILKEVKLVQPYVRIIRNKDQTYNFSDLMQGQKSGEGKKESHPLQFSLNNIQIIGGRVDFWDGPMDTQHTAKDINVGFPFISNMVYLTDTFVKPSISANINGTPYILEGQSKPFKSSRETEFSINIKDLNVPYYLAYMPVKMNFKLGSAYLSMKTLLSYRQEKDGAPSLTVRGNVSLRDVALNDLNEKAIARLPQLSVWMASVKPLAGEFHFSRIELVEPNVTIRRNVKGEINVLGLVPQEKKKEEGQGKQGKKTVVSMDDLLITNGQFTFQDNKPSQPFTLTLADINLKASNVSTAEGKQGRASLAVSLPRKGTFSIEGPIQIMPISAVFSLNMKDLYLPIFQPYVGEAVDMQLTGGRASANGNLSIAMENGIKVRYTGKAFISRFASIDRIQNSDLIKWGSLYLNGINAGYEPLSLTIQGISLSDFYSRIQINPEGTLNLQDLAVAKTEKKVEVREGKAIKPEEAKKQTKAENKVKIGTVTLQGGEIDFIDTFIKPNFYGKLIEIGGRISGLSSKENTQANVELRGRLDGYAPLEITGAINPLQKDLYVNLKASFKDVDLSPITPYSGRYVGYTIQKGKLSFDLRYLITQKKLDSQNNIFIDQLTLGDKVDSPKATKLPVSLAIALLKDRNGQIKLDIPVSGTLDDPQFSVWRIIVQVLTNILTKAATAPFALLGSLAGSGEELSFVDFDYGQSAVVDASAKKLQALDKALIERPALKLDIEGYVDAEKDREGLKNVIVSRKVKVQKLNGDINKGLAAVPVDQVKIDQKDYEKYLRMAYNAEKFPKPRNIIGLAKSLPVPEMEKLMLAHIDVRDDELRQLASERSLNVRDILLKSGEVKPDRIFIVETKTLSPPKKDKAKSSRVDFRLK
jgi:hypothetical protein